MLITFTFNKGLFTLKLVSHLRRKRRRKGCKHAQYIIFLQRQSGRKLFTLKPVLHLRRRRKGCNHAQYIMFLQRACVTCACCSHYKNHDANASTDARISKSFDILRRTQGLASYLRRRCSHSVASASTLRLALASAS